MTHVYFGMPDGKDPIIETFIYETDVIEAGTGREQRISNIETPRRRIQFTAVEVGFRDAAGSLNAVMSVQESKIIIPFWPEWTTLNGDLAAGANTVPVNDLTMRRFQIGGYVVVWQNEEFFEALLIVDINTSTGDIVTDTATVNSYTDGAVVMPAIFGSISDAMDIVSAADGGVTIGSMSVIEELADVPTNELAAAIPSLVFSSSGTVA